MNYKVKEKKDIMNMSWYLDDCGKLTISGEGKIPDYSCGDKMEPPWEEKKDQIVEICIEEGITEVGLHAFRDCSHLQKVILPDSLWRIHAYAFFNCVNLKEIQTNRPNLQYIFDKQDYLKEKTVLFGLGAFHGVPWCKERWGDFYIREDQLMICFADEKEIQIPEGIRELADYSFAYTKIQNVNFPASLEVICSYAFMEAKIEEEIFLPFTLQKVEKYAFLKYQGPKIHVPKGLLYYGQNDNSQVVCRTKYPEYVNRYGIGIDEAASYKGYKRLCVVERKEIHHKDGTVTKVREGDYIDVGQAMYRRLRHGRVLLCITYEYGKLISVKSFVWLKQYGMAEQYLMYPVEDENGIDIWSDSFTYQEKKDILYGFNDVSGEELKKENVIRFRHPDTHEEWFVSSDIGNYGGPLELKLLELWMKERAEIKIDSIEDNTENSKYRWFVSV